MLARPIRLVAMVLFAVLCAGGCGYHFASEGDALPASARTIYVEKFANASRFTGVNDQFMRYLKDEIANHKRLTMVDDESDADLIMKGTIVQVDTLPIGFNGALEPTIYQLYIVVEAELIDRRTKKVLWNSGLMSNQQQFPVTAPAVVTTSPYFLQQNLRAQDIANLPDLQVAQTQRSAWNDQMMTQLCQDMYASMANGF